MIPLGAMKIAAVVAVWLVALWISSRYRRRRRGR